jgi:hypothetical protein
MALILTCWAHPQRFAVAVDVVETYFEKKVAQRIHFLAVVVIEKGVKYGRDGRHLHINQLTGLAED